jgi:hypothetical protein
MFTDRTLAEMIHDVAVLVHSLDFDYNPLSSTHFPIYYSNIFVFFDAAYGVPDGTSTYKQSTISMEQKSL